MVEKKSKKLSMRRQCELLELARSGVYRKVRAMSSKNLELMSQIDAQYMKTPYYGSPKMTVHLIQMGYVVNIKRIKRLMKFSQQKHDNLIDDKQKDCFDGTNKK